MNNSPFQPYWASVGADEIAANIIRKVEDYYEFLSMSGRRDLWRRSWLYYYRPRINGGMLMPTGQQGELTSISVNHYRNLLSHLETMTTQQKANFEPRATNSDKESQMQVVLAASILDYYMREKKLNRNFIQGVKDSLIFGEGFVRASWNATAGKIYGKSPTGAPIYPGDMEYTNYNPFDVIRDYTKRSNTKKDWVILRDFKNKYDLAAKFPDLADQILYNSPDQINLFRTTVLNYSEIDDNDNIPVYTLLHPPTPAMPQGRYTEVIDNDTVLIDGPLPYEETHLYRIAPDEETGTIFGYTVGFDLLPVQEAVDIVYSTEVTNISTFGVQNIVVPKGHDMSYAQLSGGLNLVECDLKLGEPKALPLLNTPAEVYNFNGMLEHVMELLSGVNNVARGNVERDMSGAALALIQSMSIQFNNGLQQSYAQLVEDVGTGTIKIIQTYAEVPRVAEIVGKSNQPYLKNYKGSDLEAISRVTVDMGNPVMNTTGGKMNLADKYMEMGAVKNPDQYQQVVTTGRLEPIIEGVQANLILIKGENEGLAAGEPQRALITDEHAKHILEHTTVLANTNIRSNPNDPVVQLTLAHIQEHMTLAATPGYQAMAASLGHQITVPMQAQAPAGQDMSGQMNPAPQATQEAQDVNMPNMPSPPPGTDPNSVEAIETQQAI